MSRRGRERGWPEPPEPLPAPVVDDHTHLESIAGALPEGVPAPGIEELLRLAREAGVTRVVQIGCDLDAAPRSVELAAEHPAVVAGVAIHPNEAVLHAGVREVAPDGLTPDPRARHAVGLDEAVSRIAELARHPRVRVVGETGLDRFRSGERGRAAQVESFRAHIALAKELDLPVQIHDRDAHAEVLEVLARDGAPERTVFHCFSGDAELARRCVEEGWYLSFAGPLTFPANTGLREALACVPLDRVLLETDAPYLAPHPVRGRPNAPYLLPHTARVAADVLGVELAGLCAAVSRTAEGLYGPW